VNVPVTFFAALAFGAAHYLRAIVSLRDDGRLPWIAASIPNNGCGTARGGTIDDIVLDLRASG
jgi:hypothetical protein